MTVPDQFNNTLPQPLRFITTHDDYGKAVYCDVLPAPVPFWPVGPKTDPAGFGFAYSTSSSPVPLNGEQDLADFTITHERRKETGLVRRGGSVVRYVDYPPMACSPMHRTVSCDYAIVLVGKMECMLDSGESRVLQAGDLLVQRGTMHQWINQGLTWARMLYVLLDATEIEIKGEGLIEVLGDMEGVPASH